MLFYLLNDTERSMQVHPIFQRRSQRGEYHLLVQELKLYDDHFFAYFRMSKATFGFLLDVLRMDMAEPSSKFRNDTIGLEERLAITLKYVQFLNTIYQLFELFLVIRWVHWVGRCSWRIHLVCIGCHWRCVCSVRHRCACSVIHSMTFSRLQRRDWSATARHFLKLNFHQNLHDIHFSCSFLVGI